jgi:imidazolonepropionase-like amidohydrolase
MRRRLLQLLLVLPAALVFGAASHPAEPPALVLTHVTLIDGTDAPARPDTSVVVSGERIQAIGPSRELHAPKGAKVVDATGKFLIPGLWDMHVHWYDGRVLSLFTANGVTGVRLMFGFPLHKDWRAAIQSGKQVGPRLVLGSPIVDGPQPIWPGSIAVSSAEDGRKAVAQITEQGWDFVKVYSLLSREAYLAIVAEAARQGLPVAGHVPESVSTAEASDAGQRSIEHLTGLLLASSSREDELRQALLAAQSRPAAERFALYRSQAPLFLDSFNADKAALLAARFARNGTWHCPTLTVLHNTAYLNDPHLLSDVRLKYVPAALRQMWDPKQDFRFQARTAEDYEVAQRIYRKQLQLTGELKRAGVPLLAGTDTMNPYCFPGFSLHDELALLVEAGLTPLQALQAASRDAARFLGKQDALGTVEPGKLADLVLLDQNPLADIHASGRIHAVVQAGRLFTRRELDGLLADAEQLAAEAPR